MKSILRSVGSVLLGFAVGTVIMLAFETVDQKLHPLPNGMNPRDPAVMREIMPHLPVDALLIILAGWAVGTICGAWVTARTAAGAKLGHGMIVGIFFLGAGIANNLQFPPPLWFWVLSMALFLPAAYFGARLATGGSPSAQPEPG